jgi:hypothetical protein
LWGESIGAERYDIIIHKVDIVMLSSGVLGAEILTALAILLSSPAMAVLGTCLPGRPVIRSSGRLGPPVPPISTRPVSKGANAETFVKDSLSLLVSWIRAWGEVIMGISRRREVSTFWSKWSLFSISFVLIAVHISSVLNWQINWINGRERLEVDTRGNGIEE